MVPVASQIRIDRTSPVPLYFQVARRLEELIEAGELPPGTRLANEIALADDLGLSRPTMRQAISYLVDKGLLVRKRGVGTQVVHTRVRRFVELTSLYDDLHRSAQQPRTDVLSLRTERPSDTVATALGLTADSSPDTAVVAIERLRYARDEPLAVLRNYVPAAVAATATLSEVELSRGGLYELFRAAGIRLRAADQTIGARRATATEARLLQEPRGAPLLTMTRTTYDDAGTAVEYGTHVYRPSRYTFALTLATR